MFERYFLKEVRKGGGKGGKEGGRRKKMILTFLDHSIEYNLI